MKKLILILLGSLIFFSCSPNREERTKREIEKNEEIITMFKSKYPEDNFYFIQGLDYEKDINTNIRYRGILYSDRLEKLGYPYGLHLALEENDKGWGYLSDYEATFLKIQIDKPIEEKNDKGWGYLSDYEATFLKIQIDKPIEEKMKEIFGELSVLNNNFYPSLDGFRGMLKIMWQDISFENKGRADYTVVNVFVDRLEDIDKEEIKKKTYEFAKFLQDEINLKTYLQVYIRDNSFFEDYNLVAYQVYPPFREREDIKKILEKIKAKEEISKDEKIALVNVFYNLVNVFYKEIGFNSRYQKFSSDFSDKPLRKYGDSALRIGLIIER